MAIVFDAPSSATFTTVTSSTHAHTCTGTELVLFVHVTINGSATNRVSGITYGGAAMTKIADGTEAVGTISSSVWYLYDPATGANDIVVTMTSNSNGCVTAGSLTGVDNTRVLTSATFFERATGEGTTLSVTQASADGEVVVDFATSDAAAITATGVGHTDRVQASNQGRGGIGDQAGAVSVTCTWTMTTDQWIIIAVALAPAAASATAWGPLLGLQNNRLVA